MSSGLSPSQYNDFHEATERSKIRIKIESVSRGMFQVTMKDGYNEPDPIQVPKPAMRSFLHGAIGVAVLHKATLLFDGENPLPFAKLEQGDILVSHGHV